MKAGEIVAANRKPNKILVARRIEEILRIRLDGAEFWDVLRYVAEKQQAAEAPWIVPEGAKPLAERTIWWYVARADQLIAASCRASRKKLLRRHLAQRRNLYAKAINQGDIRTALAVLQDEAKLLGLYPATKVEQSGPRGEPIPVKVTHDVGADLAPYADLIRQFCTDPGGGTVPEERKLAPSE